MHCFHLFASRVDKIDVGLEDSRLVPDYSLYVFSKKITRIDYTDIDPKIMLDL